MSKLLGFSQSTCTRICRECVLRAGPSEGGRLESITFAKKLACARAITIGGLDNVVDARNALSEHLNVVLSTNTMRCAIHEASLGSLEKQKTPLLTTKNECWNLLNVIEAKLSMIGTG